MAAMTVTEFARLYQIPHSVVYNASFRIPYEDRRYCDGDYKHDVLMKATVEELLVRNSFHQSKLDKNKGYLNMLSKGRETDAINETR